MTDPQQTTDPPSPGRAASPRRPPGPEPDAAPYRPGYEVVAERLLALIAERQLAVGERLPTERELAAELEVSRTVMREAVKILSALGRISVRKGAGLFVADAGERFVTGPTAHFQPTNGEQVRMLFSYRALIESETVRLAAAVATPSEVQHLRALAAATTVAAREDDLDAFAVADRELHAQLARASHNIFLEASVNLGRHSVDQVSALLFRGGAPGSLVVAAQQHEAIVEAIREGDSEAAARALEDHIQTTQQQYESGVLERLWLGTAAPHP